MNAGRPRRRPSPKRVPHWLPGGTPSPWSPHWLIREGRPRRPWLWQVPSFRRQRNGGPRWPFDPPPRGLEGSGGGGRCGHHQRARRRAPMDVLRHSPVFLGASCLLAASWSSGPPARREELNSSRPPKPRPAGLILATVGIADAHGDPRTGMPPAPPRPRSGGGRARPVASSPRRRGDCFRRPIFVEGGS